MEFPSLIEHLSQSVQALRSDVEKDKRNRYKWQALHNQVSNELMMRMLSRIPPENDVTFDAIEVLPEEQDLLAFIANYGGQLEGVCPSHGAGHLQTARNGKVICMICGWYE